MVAEIVFTNSISADFEQFLQKNKIETPIILVDSNTKNFCLPFLKLKQYHCIEIPFGENEKNWTNLSYILNQLLVLNAKRNSFLFNLGGGVVSDIGGLAASLYMRGIKFVNIPTTLLSMVDASIGGKTGIDFENRKNLIGSFNHPAKIFIDTVFLKTLADEQKASAFAEIIKLAAVYSKELFEDIENKEEIEVLIKKCALLKNEIVKLDFEDQNIRQLLNFGHTIGHALEAYYLELNQPILHGFAVAKGMLMELKLAEENGFISPIDSQKIKQLILKNIDVKEITHNEFLGLQKYLINDKKNNSENIRFSFPIEIGKGVFGAELII